MSFPENYTIIADIEWDYESWSFNSTNVYRNDVTGELFYAEDSGCSCPMPFEDTTENDLTLITRPQDFIVYTNGRLETRSDPTTIDEVRAAVLAVFDHFEKARKAA